MTNVTGKKLDGVDVTIIVDRSGSMASVDTNGKTRWENAIEGSIALAGKASKYDPDGITLYTFAGNFKKDTSVGPEAVAKAFAEQEPNGSTDLTRVLSDYFGDFTKRKTSGELKPNGELVLVITDGVPDNRETVKKAIIEVTQKMDKDDELGMLFVQIGNDASATTYLKQLDDDLKGAKFDIVNTMTMDEVGERSLTEVLASAFED